MSEELFEKIQPEADSKSEQMQSNELPSESEPDILTPGAQPEYTQSASDPYMQQPNAQNIQNVQNPYMQQPNAQDEQNPYMQQPNAQDEQSPYMQQPNAQDEQSPYMQREYVPNVQNPYMQQGYMQNEQNPYMQQGYAQNMQTPYGQPPVKPPKGDGIGFGVASLALGISSVFLFGCFVNYITAVLAIIFAIVQMVKNRQKGMAIAGIVTACISILLGSLMWIGVFKNLGDMDADDVYDSFYEYYENEYPLSNSLDEL